MADLAESLHKPRVGRMTSGYLLMLNSVAP